MTDEMNQYPKLSLATTLFVFTCLYTCNICDCKKSCKLEYRYAQVRHTQNFTQNALRNFSYPLCALCSNNFYNY